MDDPNMFDPALSGCWPERPAYGDEVVMDDPGMAAEVRGVPLETKSAEPAISPADELRRLLNDMTREMRDQFSTFREMRRAAEKALEDGDEAGQKLARADVKAATDAMSLIVRTLEKIDGLQRQLARDRADEAEREVDRSGYDEAKARFVKMIKDRADETALRLYHAWKRDGPPEWACERLRRGALQPAGDEPAQDQAAGG